MRPIPRLLTGAALLVAAAVPIAARQSTAPASPLSAADVQALLDRLVSQMTLDEKIAMLHGATDPQSEGQAGYVPGVPRLGVPALRLTDGPAGVRTSHPATALPAPVALASTFDPALARDYGAVIATDGRARGQSVILAPMVNIVRVPQGGRDFETLGEDPLLASRIVAAEVTGIQDEGLIATVKHFAENNQENQRQSVSADVDERTMHEIELPGFEAAVKAGAGAVMAAYNKVNGTYASENAVLETDILRTQWGFTGFVMSDWGATHSGVPALTAGLDLEMPSGRNFAALADAVKAGTLPVATIDRAVRRMLTSMERAGLLPASPHARPVDAPDAASLAGVPLEVATEGAVLLKNDANALPLTGADLDSLVVIGPTAKTLLVGGGGSAHVVPEHVGRPFDELVTRAGGAAHITYAVGNDLDGDPIPASVLTPAGGATTHGLSREGVAPVVDATIDFTGPRALPAGSTTRWTGTITAPETGDYEIHVETAGGRGSVQFDAPAPGAGGRGGRGGGGGGSLLATALGLSNATTTTHFDAGVARPITVTAAAGQTTPMQIRLAWIPPDGRAHTVQEAVAAARAAHTAVVFAYDESQEGRDRQSLSLPGVQNDLIAAVAAANPRTIVVLDDGAPILMPWLDRVAAVLQIWYPGQDGAAAIASLLLGETAPGGRLPVTFPRRPEDAPTADPARYPGVDGHGTYSEGTLVGYRWYDAHSIAPIFPFGHGLSYTTFAYSHLTVQHARDGFDVGLDVRNTGHRAGSDVPQVYLAAPEQPPVPMAPRSLAGFARVTLKPGETRTVTVHIGARELSYWSTATHAWTIVAGRRTVLAGPSSADLPLRTTIDVRSQ